MPPVYQQVATASAVMQEVYSNKVEETLNKTNTLMGIIEEGVTEDSMLLEGERYVHSMHVRRGAGLGARREMQTLPDADTQGYAKTYVSRRMLYARAGVSGPAIEFISGNPGAFISEADELVARTTDDAKNDEQRQLWGDGTGVIARVSGANTTVTVPITGGAANPSLLRQIYSDGGMAVDIGVPGTPASKTAANKVVGYDATAGTITLTTAPGAATAANDIVSRAGNYGVNNGALTGDDGQKEITGLERIVADQTTGLRQVPGTPVPVFQGLSAATQPKWRSYRDEAANTITSTMLINAIRNVDIESGVVPDVVLASFELQDKLVTDLAAIRQSTETVFWHGYSGIQLHYPKEGRTPEDQMLILGWDRDQPKGSVYGIHLPSLVKYTAVPWGFMNADGLTLFRIPNTDGYEFVLRSYKELAARRRDTMFVLMNKTP